MTYLYKYIPNTLTILRIVSAPFLWYAITVNAIGAAVLLISFAIMSDFGDGYIARRFFFSSRAGSFLDPLADKVVILLAFMALWQQQMMPLWVVLVVAWRDIAVTFLRMFLLRRGVSLRTSLFAKSKTAFQFCALYLFVFGLGHQGSFFYWLSLFTAMITLLSSLSYWLSLGWFLFRKKRMK